MSETTPAPHSRVNAPTAALVRLADACGVSATYTAYDGERRTSSARAIRAILATMGVEAGDDAACQRAADRLEAERRSRPLPPVSVRRAGEAEAFVAAGVDQAVGEDMIFALGHGGQQGGIGGEAGGEEQGGLGPEEAGGFGFERLMLRVVAAQEARAARAGGDAAREGLRGGVPQFGALREAEIIVGGEIDARTGGEGAQAATLGQTGKVGTLNSERVGHGLAPRPKQRRADANMGGAQLDRGFKIAAHANGEAG